MGFARDQPIQAVRKRHRCDGCGGPIEIGEPATRWAGMTDGEFGTAIYHPDCRAAEVAFNMDAGAYQYGDEWYSIRDATSDEHAWLLETYPAVAARLGILDPVTPDASVAAAKRGAQATSARDESNSNLTDTQTLGEAE